MTSLVGEHISSCYSLAEQISEGFAVIDADGNMIHVNAVLADMLEYSKEELENRSFFDILHEESNSFRHRSSAEKQEIVLRTRTGTGLLVDIGTGSVIHQDKANEFYLVIEPVLKGLHEVQQKYYALFEETNDGIFLMTLEGVIMDINQRGLEMLGYSRGEIIGKSYEITMDQSEVGDSAGRIDSLLRGELLPVYERTFQRKDGTTFPAEINIALISDESKEPLYLQSIVRDISERAKAQEALKDSQERLGLALMGANLGLWDWFVDKDTFVFNKRYAEILGYELSEIQGMGYNGWVQLVHPDDLKEVEALWDGHVDGKSELYYSEYRMKTRSGEYKWVLDQGKVQERNSEGRTKRATGTLMDITERKTSEMELRDREAKLRGIISESIDGIVLFSESGIIMEWNRSLEGITGISREEAIGSTISSIMKRLMLDEETAEERRLQIQDSIQDYLALDEKPWSERLANHNLRNLDGSTRAIQQATFRISSESGPLTCSIIRDVTEIMKWQEELKASESKYRNLAEKSIQGIVISQDEAVVYCNQAYADIIGHSIEEVLEFGTEDIWRTIHSDDHDRLKERYREYRQSQLTRTANEYRIVRPSGEIRWVESFVNVIEFDGRPAMQTAVIDITERYNAEAAVRAQRDRAQLYLDLAGVVFLVLDRKGNITLLNRKGCEVLGYSPGEILGRSWFEFVPESARLEVRAAFNQIMAGTLPFIEGQERMVLTRNNEERLISWYTTPLRDESGSIVGLLSSGEDITEKRWAENALKESEENYRTLVQSISDLVFVYDADDRYVEFYGQSEEDLVVPPEEFLGRRPAEVLPNNIAAEYLRTIRKVRETGASQTFDYPLTVTGEDQWFSAKMSLHEDQSRVIAVVRNITPRVRAEETASRERQAFRVIAEAATYATDPSDLSQRVLEGLLELLEFDKGTIRLYDADRNCLFGTATKNIDPERIADVVSVDEETAETIIVSRTALRKAPVFAPNISEIEDLKQYVERLHNLEIRSLVAWPLVDEANNLLGVLNLAAENPKEMDQASISFFETVAVMFTRILERQMTQEALRKAEKKFRSVFNAIPVGLQILEQGIGGELRLVEVNPAIDKMLVSPSTPLLGKTLEEIAPSHQKELVIERCTRALKDQLQWETEDVIAEDNQVRRAVRTSIFPVLPGMIALSFLDLTERVQAEMEVQRLNEQLSQLVDERTAELAAANKELEAFAYTVSHDLRAPLRTMDGFSQAVLEDYSETLDETGRNYLQRIRQAASKMSNLIEDILSLSRVTRFDMDRTPLDLSLMAEEVIMELQRGDSKREVKVVIEKDIKARCDRRLMRAALQNLIGNAWKFTSQVEAGRIEFGTMQIEEETVYYVRDNGAGFDMEFSEKLFRPFQRLHGVDEFEGSGIGLATVERAIERHGGRIWAEGKVGKGATFYFTLAE
ncbi:MAG: PAS domain S-box protein [Promethearchaeota archaeon]